MEGRLDRLPRSDRNKTSGRFGAYFAFPANLHDNMILCICLRPSISSGLFEPAADELTVASK